MANAVNPDVFATRMSTRTMSPAREVTVAVTAERGTACILPSSVTAPAITKSTLAVTGSVGLASATVDGVAVDAATDDFVESLPAFAVASRVGPGGPNKLISREINTTATTPVINA